MSCLNDYKLILRRMDSLTGTLESATLKTLQKNKQQIRKEAIDANNIFNKLIAYNYNSKFSCNQQIQDDITKFFDLLLWAEKKCPEIVCQLFQMMALQQIQQLHLGRNLNIFLKNYILLMGNCIVDGLLAELILDHKLPHILLQAYISTQQPHEQRDQIIQYLGSFLKSYHRLFRVEWIQKFIVSKDYFQLLQVSFKFYNCTQPLTKTTVFNLVLDLLGHKQVQEFVQKNESRFQYYQSMAEMMTKTMRNQLTEFGLRIDHISLDDSINEIMSQIQDKISLWEDISKTCSKMSDMFMLPFSKNVLLPLLIGPLKYEVIPLFTLKYSLFIIQKLLKTIKNFSMLQIFIRMIFIEENVYYWPSTLSKAKKKPFIIEKILDRSIDFEQVIEQQKQNFGPGIKKFYEGVLRSKDNHFILMNTSLLNKIKQSLDDEPQLSIKFGLNYGGDLNNRISQKMINQLSQTHRLITIEAILNTLIILNSQKPLNTDLQALFLHIYRKNIEQIKAALLSKSQLWQFIVQVNQYDLLRISNIKLGKIQDMKKFQQMFKVVFLWDIKQQEASIFSFYSSIPDTVQQHFRYVYVKFLMLRKAIRHLINTQKQLPNIVSDYFMRFTANPTYQPGSQYKVFQIKSEMVQCQIIEDKTVIPARWIIDQNFFILGFYNKETKNIKIIISIKYKHITAEMLPNKQKIYVNIAVKIYDYESDRLKDKNSIKIRGIQSSFYKLIGFQLKIREKQMIFISGTVKKTQQSLPKPNFL